MTQFGLWLAVATALTATPMEEVLSSELDRAMEVLSAEEEAPHYIAAAVRHRERISIGATAGTLSGDDDTQRRLLDVEVRVGTPELDSTHPLRGSSGLRGRDRRGVAIPLVEDPEFATRHAIWREIDARFRDGAEGIVMIRAEKTVKVEEEDPAPDFAPRGPTTDHLDVPPLVLDRDAWGTVLVAVSERLDASPEVHSSGASLTAERDVVWFVDTEGTRLQHGRLHARIWLHVSATAEDGDRVSASWHVDVHDPASLPGAEELSNRADEVVARLEALLDAPRGEPYSGPVILRGKAAGVFVHEIMGHRVEGHRQKRDWEGKTFKEYVGKAILPEFVDVVDDPTVAHLAGHDLNGHYSYDDEGVAAQRVVLVDDGVMTGFLMNRSPIQGFEESNGHGRRSPGRAPVSRMGNTIVEIRDGSSPQQLRKQLLAEVRRQGLEYGIVVDEINGGFTMTGRTMPNAFNVRASTSWRVYADGRPDELIRGIDLVGTPLEAFGNLVAGGDDPGVFNGYCGAESGSVPVGSVSPSLLFRSLEFQLKEKGAERPPLLDKPDPPPPDDGAVDEGRAP